MKVLTVVVLTANLATLNASADGGGFRDILVEVDGERLTTAIWYPTEGPSGQMTLGPFSMAAIPGAPAGGHRLGRATARTGIGTLRSPVPESAGFRFRRERPDRATKARFVRHAAGKVVSKAPAPPARACAFAPRRRPRG